MKGMSLWRWVGLVGVIITIGMFLLGFVLMARAASGIGTFVEALQMQALGILFGWGCLTLMRRKLGSGDGQGK